jgi:hypothetical protein
MKIAETLGILLPSRAMAMRYFMAAFSTIILYSVASGHTMEELKKELGEVSQSLAEITAAYETASQEAESDHPELAQNQQDALKAEWAARRERLHSAQHEMMKNDLTTDRKQVELQTVCIELRETIRAQERKAQKLKQAGKAKEAEQVYARLHKAKAFATANCPKPGN